MNVAMLPAAALVSSAVFEMVSLFKSSSRTLTDFWFSDFVVAAVDGADSITSADGMIWASMVLGFLEEGIITVRRSG